MESADTQAARTEHARDEQWVPSAGAGPTSIEEPWSTAHKVAFRFAFSYICLYLYPFSSTLGWFWWFWVRWENNTFETPWRQMVPWVAARILHLGYPVTVNPIRDSAYQYVKVLCLLAIAALATIVWSFIDRKRTSYQKLDRWTHWYVRVVVGIAMIGFGACKIIPVQSLPPDLVTLMQPYGDIGGNRFFWEFLGASGGYQIFAGLTETAAGVLLLIPGLTTLGALASVGVLIAVFTQSGFYGVPDKLAQLHLLVLALFLVLPDVPRLMNALVFNRATKPETSRPLFRQRWMNYSLWGIQWALGVYIILLMLGQGKALSSEINKLPITTPFYGIWTVEKFTADGEDRPPALTDNLRWRRVIFDGAPGLAGLGKSPKVVATIQEMNSQFSPYIATVDTKNGTLSLKTPSSDDLNTGARFLIHTAIGEETNAELNYKRPSPDTLTLEGVVNGHRLLVTLKKEDRQFALRDMKFRWVVEEKDLNF
jgi:hypothetical protein